MIDTRQIMYDVERCISHVPDACRDCSHYHGTVGIGCMEALMEDTLALIKEQKVVAVHDPGAYCPKCGWMLYPEDHPHHCGNCGQAVKWT